MNNMSDFDEMIKKMITNLSDDKLILFCNLNCEKVLPGYQIFTEVENWGDYEFFKLLNEEVYRLLLDHQIRNYQQWDKQLEDNFPNLDEFDSIAASYGFDACVVFNQMISFFLDGNGSHAINSSTGVINTIDMFIQDKENVQNTSYTNIAALESFIESDEYMQREYKRQLALLEELRKTEISKDAINRLRKLNDDFGPLIAYGTLRDN
jgi:uncharacterized protein YjaG (DUF416 family)